MSAGEVAILALIPAYGIGSYIIGWWWRGRYERKREAERFDWRQEH